MGFVPSTWFAKSEWFKHAISNRGNRWQSFRDDFAETERVLKDLGADVVLTYDDISSDERAKEVVGDKVWEPQLKLKVADKQTREIVLGSSFAPGLCGGSSDEGYGPPCEQRRAPRRIRSNV